MASANARYPSVGPITLEIPLMAMRPVSGSSSADIWVARSTRWATAAASARQHQVEVLLQLSTRCSTGVSSSIRNRSASSVRESAINRKSRARSSSDASLAAANGSIRSPMRSVHMLAMTWMPPTCRPSMTGLRRGRSS